MFGEDGERGKEGGKKGKRERLCVCVGLGILEKTIDPGPEERRNLAKRDEDQPRHCCVQDPALAFVRDTDTSFLLSKSLTECESCVNK